MAPKRRREDQSSPAPAPPPPLLKTKRQPVVVFAHGAGAPSSSDWMVHWKKMVQDALDAVEVVTFDYPYMSDGKRRAPPKAEKLIDHHLGVVKDATGKYQGHPLILMGKSMGSRVSCMVASSDEIDVSAVVCLGYPLKGVKGTVRDETLLQLQVPTMFVQGSKDGLCPLDRLESTRKKMTCKNELRRRRRRQTINNFPCLDVAGDEGRDAMTSCWSSVLAVLGGRAADEPDDERKGEDESKAAMLHRRLLDGWAAAASEEEEVKNLTAEVRALERALGEASGAQEAAEAKRREAEARAEAAEAELRAATARHEAQVEELRRALDAQEDRNARIRELEDRIRDLNNAHSKWRFF